MQILVMFDWRPATLRTDGDRLVAETRNSVLDSRARGTTGQSPDVTSEVKKPIDPELAAHLDVVVPVVEVTVDHVVDRGESWVGEDLCTTPSGDPARPVRQDEAMAHVGGTN